MQTPKKLRLALKKLGELCEADLPKSRIVHLVEQGEVSEQQVYETLERRGYTWQNGKWQLFQPSWLQDAIEDFGLVLEKGRPPRSKFAPPIKTPLTHFRDYLASMEAFIEADKQRLKQRLKDYESEMRKSKDEDEWAEWEATWYFTNYNLEALERFPTTLRRSFFINLYSYIEAYLMKKCKLMEKCKQDFRGNVIDRATEALVGKLRGKIPQWPDIKYHIDIRNCLVHSDGKLDKDKERNTKIKDYAKKEPTLKIVDDEIFLEKGFCEHTLEILDEFLYLVDLISEERK